MSATDPLSNWITPNSVMKSRKLKERRHALKARLNGSLPLYSKQVNKRTTDVFTSCHRNPFLKSKPNAVVFKKQEGCEIQQKTSTNLLEKSTNILPPILQNERVSNLPTSDVLHVDWSLKTRMRIHSSTPLPWKHTFKTSEEASGTTGFARCLNSKFESEQQRTLDTSSNAQFYQCCLFWQNPSLPSLTLFPRNKNLKSSLAGGGLYGSNPTVAAALHSEWSESLRSLYQLLRVRQCPYFYVCASTFTCLFRAAGVAGFTHTHALITPTTKGFRNVMKNEGIEFSLPLLKKSRSSLDGSLEEKSEETSDAEEPDEETSEFLDSLGLKMSQFPNLSQNRLKTDKDIQGEDRSPESLVFIEDMELQGLFNFFLNCNSCVTSTGPLAGVPPTLLAPVAFHGATLKSLKVSSSTIRTPMGNTMFSMDIQGPILPTTVVQVSSLLSSSNDSYSMSFLPITDTIPLCSVSSDPGTSMPMAFATEGLIDSGLDEDIRDVVCLSGEDFNNSELPRSYREIKYSNKSFTWTNKIDVKL